MPRVFGRAANLWARLTLAGLVVGVLGLFVAGEVFVRSPYVTSAGLPIEQPIPFSHKHHVTDDGIDCRYCHTTVETSSYAGMPATQTCMNCHSQIWAQSPVLEPVRASFANEQPLSWNPVNYLPDFVYFNHSAHVQHGVGCSTCHGQVQEMPLTSKAASFQMSWCLECHRDPARFVRPREAVFDMTWQPPANQAQVGRQLVEQYHIQSLTNCSTCHR